MNIDINKFTLKQYADLFTLFPSDRKIQRREFKFNNPLTGWDTSFHCESFENGQYHLFIGEKTKTKISWLEFNEPEKKNADYSILLEVGFPINEAGEVSADLKGQSVQKKVKWAFISDDLDIDFELAGNKLTHCRIYDRKILIKNSPHKTFYRYREVENPEQYLNLLRGLWFNKPDNRELEYFGAELFAFIDGREMYQINMDRFYRGRLHARPLMPDRLKVIDTRNNSFRIAMFSTDYSQNSTEWINFDEKGDIKKKGRNLWIDSRVNLTETLPREKGEPRKLFMIRDFKSYQVKSSEEGWEFLKRKYPGLKHKNGVFRGFGIIALSVSRELQQSGHKFDTDEIPYTLEESKCSSDVVLNVYTQLMEKEKEFRDYLERSQLGIQSAVLQQVIDMDPFIMYTNGKMIQSCEELNRNQYLSAETMFDQEAAQKAEMKMLYEQVDNKTANLMKKLYSPPGADILDMELHDVINNFEKQKKVTINLGTDYNPAVDDLWQLTGKINFLGTDSEFRISTRDLNSEKMESTAAWIQKNMAKLEESVGQSLFEYFKECEKRSLFQYESNIEILDNWNDKRRNYREMGFPTQKAWKEELTEQVVEEKKFLDVTQKLNSASQLNGKFIEIRFLVGDELLDDCPEGRFIVEMTAWNGQTYQACFNNFEMYNLVTGEEIVLGRTYRAGTPFLLLGHTMPALFSLADKEHFPGERLIETYKWLIGEKENPDWLSDFKDKLFKQIKTSFKDEGELLKDLECNAYDLIKNMKSIDEVKDYLKFSNVTFGGMVSKREGDVSFSFTVEYPGDDYHLGSMLFINDYKLIHTPSIMSVFDSFDDDVKKEKKEKKKERKQQGNQKNGHRQSKRNKNKNKSKLPPDKLVIDGKKYFAKGKESEFEPLTEEELGKWHTKWQKKLPREIIALLESQNGGGLKENAFGKAIPLTKIPGISGKDHKNSLGPVPDKIWNSLFLKEYFDNKEVMEFCLGKQENMFLLDESEDLLVFMDYNRAMMSDTGNDLEKPCLTSINKKGYPRKDYIKTFRQIFKGKTGRLSKYHYEMDPLCDQAMAVKKLFSIKIDIPLSEFEGFCKSWAKKTKRAYSKRLFEYCCWHKKFKETMTVNKITPVEVRVLEHFFKDHDIPHTIPEIPGFNLELVCRAVDISDSDRVLHTCLRTCKNGFLTYVAGFGGGELEGWNSTENREMVWNLNRGLNNR